MKWFVYALLFSMMFAFACSNSDTANPPGDTDTDGDVDGAVDVTLLGPCSSDKD